MGEKEDDVRRWPCEKALGARLATGNNLHTGPCGDHERRPFMGKGRLLGRLLEGRRRWRGLVTAWTRRRRE